LNESSKNLVAYCGLYCSACGLCQGRIKQSVENLRKVISAYGFDEFALELANREPAFQHYTEFEKVLEAIDRFVKNLGVCPGCVAGGGDPNCAIRECCKQKAHITCIECIEMDICEKLITPPLFQHRIKALKAALRLNP